MRVGLVRTLGWLVIAHGLAQAVLPLRGAAAPGVLVGDWVPVGLTIVTMIGFVAAGLGLLGLRPFEGAISPLLVLASGLSLVAIARLGHADLWVGGALDVLLLLIGLWRAVAGWPSVRRPHARVWHVLALASSGALFFYVTAAATLWPWHRSWGSTGAELAMALPGDRLERQRALEIQHAVTIDVTPDAVWPWLVQLGQDRAGFYSYDWLERAFGADVHNVTEIRADWQQRQTGDFVRATQRDYLGGVLGTDLGWRVTALQPGRALVLENWGAFVLLPTEDGRTRFIVRTPAIGHAQMPVWSAALTFMAFELPHFIMERRMMLTIKALAEERAATIAAREM